MRMWMLPPEMLCDKHLLGEHGEIHKFRHTFVKHYKIDGRMSPIVQIEPARMATRHDELAEEMTRRGMNHKSPYELPGISYLDPRQRFGKVDRAVSFNDLIDRCDRCKARIHEVIEIPWHFTFPQSTQLKDCYRIVYGTYDKARRMMFQEFGTQWAFQYALPELAGVEKYGLRKI